MKDELAHLLQCHQDNDLYQYSFSESQSQPTKSFLEYTQSNVLHNLLLQQDNPQTHHNLHQEALPEKDGKRDKLEFQLQ